MCPYSSPHCGTPSRNIKQLWSFIVALLDNGKFNNQLQEHCESIKELNYRFTKIMNLHSTLLGIFDQMSTHQMQRFDQLSL